MGSLTELNKRTRDENIRISEVRGRKIEVGKEVKSSITKEEVQEKLKPKLTKIKKIKAKSKPFLVLKDQQALLAERDFEIPEELAKSYLEQSKTGNGKIKDKGDLRQKNLYFSNVNNCPREIYYKFFEPERARDYTVKGLILFDDGDKHHQNIQRRLEDRGKVRNPEGFLEIPEVGATGYYDGLVNVGVENGWNLCDLLEIKSKLPYACEEIAQRDYDQAQLYHYGARYSKRLAVKRIKIRNIRILYKDRAVQTDDVHFSWMVKLDLDRQHEILEYFKWLHDIVVGKKFLSPHPFEKKSQNCTWCRFKEWCWRKYPDQIIERQVDSDEIKLPDVILRRPNTISWSPPE